MCGPKFPTAMRGLTKVVFSGIINRSVKQALPAIEVVENRKLKWMVDAGDGVTVIEADNEAEAITQFIESGPNNIGLFIEVYKPGTPSEDRVCYFAVKELLKRHKLRNKDAVDILNRMGFEAAEDKTWYKLLRDNAQFFKKLDLEG